MTPEMGIAIVGFIGALTALVKVVTEKVKSRKEIDRIQDDRKSYKESLAVWQREVEMRLNAHDESLKAGNERFDKTDSKIDQLSSRMDSKIDQLSSKMDAQSSKIDNLIGAISFATGGRISPQKNNGGLL